MLYAHVRQYVYERQLVGAGSVHAEIHVNYTNNMHLYSNWCICTVSMLI